MVTTQDRVAQESEALRHADMQTLGPKQEEVEFGSALPGVEGKYTEVMVDPQWLSAWKMYLDREGNEYGVPVLLPRGQWDQGGVNALMNQRRRDGGYWFTLIKPSRLAPDPKIECFVGVCPKKVNTRIELVEHVRTFHADEATNYNAVLEQIMQQAVADDPRLQKVVASLETLEQTAMGEAPVDLAEVAAEVPDAGPELFHCGDAECKRFFDTAEGKATHEYRAHKPAAVAAEETPDG